MAIRIGIDEVNYSPSIAGDCVVAACSLKEDAPPGLLKDSKQTTLNQRLAAFAWLQTHSVYVIEIAAVNHLPGLGIYHSRNQAAWRAVHGLIAILGKSIYDIVMDGLSAWEPKFYQTIPIDMRDLGRLDIRFEKDADGRIPEVMAASIIAKVYCDALFHGWGTYWPGYTMERDHGSLSDKHLSKLRADGASPIHRVHGYAADWWSKLHSHQLKRDT